MKKERQELHCHACYQYVQFDIDVEQNGNHVIICPVCGHEHCRYVRNGVITEGRWDRRNGDGTITNVGGNNYAVTGLSSSASSIYAAYVVNSPSNCDCAGFMYASWNTGGYSGNGYC